MTGKGGHEMELQVGASHVVSHQFADGSGASIMPISECHLLDANGQALCGYRGVLARLAPSWHALPHFYRCDRCDSAALAIAGRE
jgi:hypothetical protein